MTIRRPLITTIAIAIAISSSYKIKIIFQQKKLKAKCLALQMCYLIQKRPHRQIEKSA